MPRDSVLPETLAEKLRRNTPANGRWQAEDVAEKVSWVRDLEAFSDVFVLCAVLTSTKVPCTATCLPRSGYHWITRYDQSWSVWDGTVFSKNRERPLRGDIAQAFFEAVVAQAGEKNLLSDGHFTVDGTLLEAWAGGGFGDTRQEKR
jgi:hypothetical protein